MSELTLWEKINANYYNAKYPKFDYKKYEEELLEQLNNTPLTKAAYDFALGEIKESVKELRKQHLEEYRKEEARLNYEFFKDCEQEFGFTDFPDEVKSFIHGKAYEDGHAYGFSEIATYYDDLVEFAKICKEALTK